MLNLKEKKKRKSGKTVIQNYWTILNVTGVAYTGLGKKHENTTLTFYHGGYYRIFQPAY